MLIGLNIRFKTKDRVSIESMLAKQKMLSINQMNAQTKLIEMWKASNLDSNPLDIRKISSDRKCAMTRGMAKENLMKHKHQEC